MPTRITLNAALSLCLVLLSLSITICAQSPSRTDSSVVQDVRFQNAQAKIVLKTLGQSSGLNIVFDESVPDYLPVTITLKDVTMESAIRTVLIQQNLAAVFIEDKTIEDKTIEDKTIEDKTITVFRDNSQNLQKFAEYKQWPGKRDLASAQEASRAETSHEETQNFAFHDEDLNVVLSTLGNSLKLNIVFHQWVKPDDKVTIDLRDVTTELAIEKILIQKKYMARMVEKNTVMVFRDDSSNRHRYAQYKPWPSIMGEQR